MAAFVICIGTLRNVDRRSDFALCQIGILSEVAYTMIFVQVDHPRTV